MRQNFVSLAWMTRTSKRGHTLKKPSKGRTLTRRQFTQNAIAAGATAGFAQSDSRKALGQDSAPTLSLYVVLWRSVGPRIPWESSNPRKIAEQFCHLIWSYKGSFHLKQLLLRENKGSVIGHAALVATLRLPKKKPQSLVFSNTGGSVGVYWRGTPKFPDRPPYKKEGIDLVPIVACFYVSETLAAHLGDGRWESPKEFRKRVATWSNPKVQKKVIVGESAEPTFRLLDEIRSLPERFPDAYGGPKHYGTNTTKVRWLEDPDKAPNPPREMTQYDIGGKKHEIHGGCGNAVASVLHAVGQEDLIPRNKIQFEFEMSLSDFSGIVLPVIIGRHGFRNGVAVDLDLTSELAKVPTSWGSGYPVRIIDPNHWYEAVPGSNRRLLAELEDQLDFLT
jgi:hypothetical protein